jgi:hypothetical protein
MTKFVYAHKQINITPNFEILVYMITFVQLL